MNNRGFTKLPLYSTIQCRCAPVDDPETVDVTVLPAFGNGDPRVDQPAALTAQGYTVAENDGPALINSGDEDDTAAPRLGMVDRPLDR